MKKIFAIALALVMVLSMASAFALPCSTDFAWGDDAVNANCGQGKVEVIPYIRANNGCGSYEWQANNCAAAVTGENIYYAIKVTVDAYPNADWWLSTTLKVTYKGLVNTAGLDLTNASAVKDIKNIAAVDLKDSDKAEEYYWNFTDKTWDKVDKNFTLGDKHVKTEMVNDARKAKVCATLKSEDKSVNAVKFGDWTVNYKNGNLLEFQNFEDNEAVDVHINAKSRKVETVKYYTRTGAGAAWELKFVTKAMTDTEFVGDGAYANQNWSCDAAGKEIKEVFDYFKFTFGTKLTDKKIKDNFGWKTEIESCFSWSDKATAIVNPDCKIEIPKTGDVSVVAYAVMALVAAAGAMGLKK